MPSFLVVTRDLDRRPRHPADDLFSSLSLGRLWSPVAPRSWDPFTSCVRRSL
jgi:hypothetical protein